MFFSQQRLSQAVSGHSHAVNVLDPQESPLGLFGHLFISDVDSMHPRLVKGIYYHLIGVEAIREDYCWY